MRKPCRRCGGTGHEPNPRALAAKVRTRRELLGWGVRELARQAECSPAFVSDIEHGRRGGGLTGPVTRRILAILEITP